MNTVGGFIDLVSSAWIQWLTAILFAALLVAELAFMRETLYPRNYMLQRMPLVSHDIGSINIEKHSRQTGSASDVELKRTTQLFFLNFRPVPGLKHPKPWDSITRFGLTFKYPVVVIAIGIYCFTWYWWVLSIITEIPCKLYTATDYLTLRPRKLHTHSIVLKFKVYSFLVSSSERSSRKSCALDD
jgi:hypothetical protein